MKPVAGCSGRVSEAPQPSMMLDRVRAIVLPRAPSSKPSLPSSRGAFPKPLLRRHPAERARLRTKEDPSLTLFTDLGLATPILEALASEGYQRPTPIQAQAIPHVLAGRDL